MRRYRERGACRGAQALTAHRLPQPLQRLPVAVLGGSQPVLYGGQPAAGSQCCRQRAAHCGGAGDRQQIGVGGLGGGDDIIYQPAVAGMAERHRQTGSAAATGGAAVKAGHPVLFGKGQLLAGQQFYAPLGDGLALGGIADIF